MSEQSIRDFAAALGAKTPTPGGGGAASHTALFGASLGKMLVEFARGRQENLSRPEVFDAAEARLETSIRQMQSMADRDAASFQHVANAYSLPRGTNDEKATRTRAIQEALLGAMIVPEELVHMCRDAMLAIASIRDGIGRNLIGDAGTASALLSAASRAGELLVRSNCSYLADRDKALVTLARIDAVVQETRALRGQVDDRVESLIDG